MREMSSKHIDIEKRDLFFGVDYEAKNAFPRILLVEDVVSTIQPVNLVFLELGCLPDVAFCGRDALSMYMNKYYDLIVLDWGLPDIEGGALLKYMDSQIEKHSIKKANEITPVILFSATKREDLNIERSRHFDIIDHWQKPMSMGDIVRAANKSISQMI